MTIEARRNLQMGVPEDRRFPATDYTSDGSFLDNYLLEKARIHKWLNEEQQKRQQAAEEKAAAAKMEKEIEKQVEKAIEKALDDLLKDFK